MTKTTVLTDTSVPLKSLALHPLNARAHAQGVYDADDISVLAASIAELGLLNPLIVQKTEKAWGVIAGGRRLAALTQLAQDRARKGLSMSSKIACRVLPQDVAAATAITLAENITQKAMEPLDEFEAFARMMETGKHSPESIARIFGVERRQVLERLRYGRVHPEIRAAVRRKELSLEAMKAFAENPDHDTQMAVFEAVQAEGSYVSAYQIRNRLQERGTKIGDDLGALVIGEYREAKGAIATDLIEEDSVLIDRNLIDKILIEKLEAAAEAERARHGFAWAEARREIDYTTLSKFGRVYPTGLELDDDTRAKADEITNRLGEIETQRDALEGGKTEINDADLEALDDEWSELDAAYDALTTGFLPEDAARAGVIATWERGQISLTIGLVRPEDKVTASGAKSSENQAGQGEITAGLALSESLVSDLRTEQAMIVGNALAAQPELAHDLLLFKIITDVLTHTLPATYMLEIRAENARNGHGRPNGIDARLLETRAELHEKAGVARFTDLQIGKDPRIFQTFRALEPAEKSRLAALALAESLRSSSYGPSEPLMCSIAHELVPEVRAVWRPTGEAFFGRLKKADLLTLLASDLHLPEEATRLATAKKLDIVDYLEKLFAEPFATLSEEQRNAVDTWCPSPMRLETDRFGHEEDSEAEYEDPDDESVDPSEAEAADEETLEPADAA